MARSTWLMMLIKNIYTLWDADQEYIHFMGTDMARSTRLVSLIKNIYTLWGQKRPSLGVSLPPFPVVTVMAAHCPR